MSINLDEIREKITSKENRQEILNEIIDITYFGPVGETIKKMSKKNEEEGIEQINILHDRANYLRTLVEICFERIETFEAEK
jgi:hypothetical protein